MLQALTIKPTDSASSATLDLTQVSSGFIAKTSGSLSSQLGNKQHRWARIRSPNTFRKKKRIWIRYVRYGGHKM